MHQVDVVVHVFMTGFFVGLITFCFGFALGWKLRSKKEEGEGRWQERTK